jgi:hypothetical protein
VNKASLFREEFEVPPADHRDRPGAIVELPSWTLGDSVGPA